MRKLLSAVLLLALLTVSFGAVSCQKRPDSSETTATDNGTLPTTDRWGRPIPASPLAESLYFPDETVTVLSRDEWASSGQFIASELDADVVRDAIVERNAMIKSRLGVDIESMVVEGGSWNANLNQKIRNEISGNLFRFDMIANFAYYGSALAQEGYYYDLSKLPHLHTGEAWWNQDYIRQSVIADRMYMAVNDSCLLALRYTLVTFFNKNLLAARAPELNIYEAVDENEWTIDYFDRLLREIGDTSENGVAGMVTSTSAQNIDAFFSGFGLRACTINGETGLPELSLDNDLTIACFEQVRRLFFDNPGVTVNGTATTDYLSARNLFAENGSVFSTGQLDNGGYFLQKMTGAKFGILPMPKTDEASPYTTTPQDAYDFLAVPAGGMYADKARAERSGAVMEYMAYASYLTTKPSYFESITRLRYSDAPDDARMFNLISQNIYFDFGMIYSSSVIGVGTHLGHFWRTLFQNKSTNFSSEYAKSSEAWGQQLSKVIEMLTE